MQYLRALTAFLKKIPEIFSSDTLRFVLPILTGAFGKILTTHPRFLAKNRGTPRHSR
jgi:hypothetical protein